MTYIPYLGTFFFSRYPSVALARNIHIEFLLAKYSRAPPDKRHMLSEIGASELRYLMSCPLCPDSIKMPLMSLREGTKKKRKRRRKRR